MRLAHGKIDYRPLSWLGFEGWVEVQGSSKWAQIRVVWDVRISPRKKPLKKTEKKVLNLG